MKILLVDDERDLTELLTFALRRAGFTVLAAHDAATALKLLRSEPPDLAVLDVNLGADSGFDLLREMRRRSQVPVIMLTAHGAEDDKVLGLELGADDYVTKPFSHRELLARISAHLRRAGHDADQPAPGAAVLQAGPLLLDGGQHSVTRDGEPLGLTVTEFRLLRCLMASPNVVMPGKTLLKQVWGYDDNSDLNLVRTAIHRLRRKIEHDPSNPRLLLTVAGVGFILKCDQAVAAS